MKNIFKTLLFAGALCIAGQTASAQSLKDLLNKVKGSSAVQEVVETVTGVSLQADIKGTWNYSGIAVKLESENLLKSTAANLAASQIEEKLDGYASKIGLKSGTFGFTFSEDGTFSTTFKGKSISGTYALDEASKTLTLTYGKSSVMKGFSMKATANVTSSQLDLMFNADKLLSFIEKLSSTTDNSTLSSIAAIAEQYDGMLLGFELSK
ncbi:MAG: DUF4923 family protein [Bacteroidales bacterium]|nr:DUF4923 family protein [Bacteroidales bacterium]